MHTPVLLRESIDFLGIRADGIYLDVTAGGGGHSAEILKHLGPSGKLILSDCDPKALCQLKEKFGADQRVVVVHARFSELFETLENNYCVAHHKVTFGSASVEAKIVTPFREIQYLGRISGLLADLGFSSAQLQDERGLSFSREAFLDMRLDPRLETTAADYLVDLSEKELADVFLSYGEERGSHLIARALVLERRASPIQTTNDLKRVAEKVLGRFYQRQKIHPATRIFQALRILVNREEEELKALLKIMPEILGSRGRAVIISFHSLEDRVVKKAFLQLKNQGWSLLTKKPVGPSKTEIESNPRSRSAKMRGIEKIK